MTRKLMTKTTSVLMVLTGLFLGSARSTSAQSLSPLPPQYFVNVNVGAQPQDRTITSNTTFPLYDETATIDSTYQIPSGAFFEIGGGYHIGGRYPILRRVTIGASVSFFNHNGSGGLAGLIPDPLFFDRPATVNVDVGELEHKETGVHVFATYWMPISEKMDVTVSIGPSFIHVTQDVVSSITVPEPTQDIIYTLENESGTAVGINVGVDGNYMLTRNYGVGAFLRYAGGSEDLPHAPDLKVGGFQVGVGARIRF
jgi:Outer membrane protein beta-barrel domain